MTDESVVVWLPTAELFTAIPDPRVWTSLCLYHDQVIVCSWPLGIERRMLDQMAAAHKGEVGHTPAPGIRELADAVNLPSIEAGIKFIDMLEILEREGVVDAKPWKWAGRLLSTGGYRMVTREEMSDLKETHPQASPDHALLAYAISHEQGYPIAIDCATSREACDPGRSIEYLDSVLAESAICQLALPVIKAIRIDDLLAVRTALRDELLEFRAGIRSLTWLLHQQVKRSRDLQEIRHEAGNLVKTTIEGSLMSFENRMRRHKDRRFGQMLFGGARVLVDIGTWSLVSLGKAILTLAGAIDGVKPPEDQVASYLYRVKEKFRANS